MTNGRIISGIAGTYQVKTTEKIYLCKPRGKLRNGTIVPLVGDNVEITIQNDGSGVIEKILVRENYMIRPAVANVDQIILTFSLKSPDISYLLLDKFLALVESKGLDIVICINKIDIASKDDIEELLKMYDNTKYEIVLVSSYTGEGIEKLKEIMKDKINVFAGPSGVGKSSILNCVQEGLQLKVGDISEKTNRGKHTTRSVELIDLKFGGFVLDTPGFTSLELNDILADDLKNYFVDIREYSDECKYRGCNHISEPGCAVKTAVDNGEINTNRYNRYLKIYEEVKELNKKTEKRNWKR